MPSPSFSIKARQRTLVAAAAIYSVLLAIVSWKHTFWRDEAQAWLIARDSSSLASVVHNVRYEGTPPLWHFVLYFITRFTRNPEWMKLPNYIFSVAAVALILSAARLSVWVRLGFAFSYFMLFEYAVIDRDYMIGIMLLLAAVTLFKNDKSTFKISIALSLAAFTSLPALVVAFCVYPVHLVRSIADSEIEVGIRKPRQWLRALGIKRATAQALFVICVLVSLAIIHPPADEGGEGSLLRHGQWVRLLRLFKFSSFTEAYLPIPDSLQFWNRSIFSDLGRSVSTIVGLALVVSLCFWFRRKEVRYFFIITSGLLMAEMAAARTFAMRHVGWLFIVFLLSVILERETTHHQALSPVPIDGDPKQSEKPSWRSFLLSGILFAQIATGLFAIAVSMRYPFSPSKQLVVFLHQQHLDQAPLVFLPDCFDGAVLAYLQRPNLYSIERGTRSSFMIWDEVEARPQLLPSKAQLSAASENGINPVLITEGALSKQQTSTLGIKFIAAFKGGVNASDHYFLYK